MDVKLYPAPLAGSVAAPPSKSRWHRELICQAAAGRFPPVSPDAPEDIRATAAGLRVLYGGGEEVPCGASGSTLRFLLPLAMGACTALGGNVVTDAFGVVALVALAPPVAIQIMGVIYVHRAKAVAENKADLLPDDGVIDLEDEEI